MNGQVRLEHKNVIFLLHLRSPSTIILGTVFKTVLKQIGSEETDEKATGAGRASFAEWAELAQSAAAGAECGSWCRVQQLDCKSSYFYNWLVDAEEQ